MILATPATFRIKASLVVYDSSTEHKAGQGEWVFASRYHPRRGLKGYLT